jgi:hypothetical protein
VFERVYCPARWGRVLRGFRESIMRGVTLWGMSMREAGSRQMKARREDKEIFRLALDNEVPPTFYRRRKIPLMCGCPVHQTAQSTGSRSRQPMRNSNMRAPFNSVPNSDDDDDDWIGRHEQNPAEPKCHACFPTPSKDSSARTLQKSRIYSIPIRNTAPPLGLTE